MHACICIDVFMHLFVQVLCMHIFTCVHVYVHDVRTYLTMESFKYPTNNIYVLYSDN